MNNSEALNMENIGFMQFFSQVAFFLNLYRAVFSPSVLAR